MIDEIDKPLLRQLQNDSSLTNQELGDMLGLSASQIGRRRQALEQAGYVERYGAHLSPSALGLDVQAFVQVVLLSHARDEAQSFLRLCEATQEIVSVWTLTGEADYLLRVYCTDLAQLNTLLQDCILRHAAVSRVQSQIVLDQVKRDAPLPI